MQGRESPNCSRTEKASRGKLRQLTPGWGRQYCFSRSELGIPAAEQSSGCAEGMLNGSTDTQTAMNQIITEVLQEDPTELIWHQGVCKRKKPPVCTVTWGSASSTASTTAPQPLSPVLGWRATSSAFKLTPEF